MRVRAQLISYLAKLPNAEALRHMQMLFIDDDNSDDLRDNQQCTWAQLYQTVGVILICFHDHFVYGMPRAFICICYLLEMLLSD